MNVIFPDRYSAILPDAHAVVTMEQPGAAPTQAIIKDNLVVSSQAIIPWGDANNFPQTILKQGRKSTIIPTALKWQANMLASKVIPFQVDYDDKGNEILSYVRDQEIYEFLNNRYFKQYVKESANDIFWLLNIFPEVILSKNRKKITHLHPNEAAYSRIGQQNSRGVSEYMYYNGNWPFASHSDSETTQIRMLDPYQYDLVDWTREGNTRDFKFIYPSSYPTPGTSFYQIAHWDGIRTSGWLDVLEKVPALKKALFENQMTIKYHIQIPREYWENEYGVKWTKGTADERDAIRKERVTSLNKNLMGAEKAGIAIATEFGMSTIDGKAADGWKIEALPDKLKDGAYLADNMEATAHLLYALGLDPTLVGFASKEMGSRSGGSDKRESLDIYLSQLQGYKDVLFAPLDFVAEFNGWKNKYPGLEFRTKHTILTTLDTGAGTTQKAA